MGYAQDFSIGAVQVAMGGIERTVEGEGRCAISSSDGKAGSIVNQPSDSHKIKEGCWVDRLRLG